MRVIAGNCRGLRIDPVPGHGTRPTAERVREALFSRLESRYELAGARVLDLFAGTGALGIEALSRGAARLTSVESDRRAADVLKGNLKRLGLAGNAKVLRRDVAVTLTTLANHGEMFEGVLIDPPYGDGLVPGTIASLVRLDLLAPGAWVVVETAAKEELEDPPDGLVLIRADRYGDSKMTLLESTAKGEDR